MRKTAAFLILWAATLAYASSPAASAEALRGASQMTSGGVSVSTRCAAEAAAYSDVAGIANSYKDSGIFADALYDLREQLLDCLATSDEEPDDGSLLPSGDSRSV
jgi:hypothetical protein